MSEEFLYTGLPPKPDESEPNWVFRKEESERLWGGKVRDAMSQVIQGINDGRAWIAECPDLDFDIVIEVRKQAKG